MSQVALGRANQRSRTRADLLRAACALASQGQQPTVADVADAAGISRATAYRYFSRADDMVREATLDAVSDIMSSAVLDGGEQQPVEARLDTLVGGVFRLVTENEALFRQFLANAVVSDTPGRGGRRLDWVRTVLQPLEGTVDEPQRRRLVHALALLTGIETLVVLQDICGLDPDEAEATARWAAATLLAGAASMRK